MQFLIESNFLKKDHFVDFDKKKMLTFSLQWKKMGVDFAKKVDS